MAEMAYEGRPSDTCGGVWWMAVLARAVADLVAVRWTAPHPPSFTMYMVEPIQLLLWMGLTPSYT